jgi:hypothetical protein
MDEKINVKTHPVTKADAPQGSAEGGKAGAYAYLPTSIAAFQAANDLLARGETLYRAPEPFTDNGTDFGAGAIIIPADPALANELANQYSLTVYKLNEQPENAVPMSEQRIAVYGDAGVRHSLETLGFDFDSVGTSDINGGILAGYDVFINRDLRWSRINTDGKASVSAWFAAGGDYVGLGYRGRAIDFAVDAGWVEVDYGYISGNAILEIDYDPDDSVAAGFLEDGYAFVYRSVWFTDWDGMQVSARIDGGDFLTSGFWQNWQTSGANGMPVIVHQDSASSDVTLIGINNTFRGHPENTFRILGNAIYNGLD